MCRAIPTARCCLIGASNEKAGVEKKIVQITIFFPATQPCEQLLVTITYEGTVAAARTSVVAEPKKDEASKHKIANIFHELLR